MRADGADVTIEDPPRAYAITYRITSDGAESTERVVARRPFSSRVEVDAGGAVVARRVSRFATLVVEGDEATSSLTVSPALGTADVRPDAVLDSAVDAGIVERREVREVAGRTCQVHRFGSSAADGTIVPVGSTPGEHADVCIDGRGLVLEEWWVRDGKPLRQRLATDVDVGALVDDEMFTLTGERDAARSRSDGSIAPTTAPAAFRIEPPRRFETLGRYDLTIAQVERTVIADVWTDGADLLVLEHGVGDVDPHPYGTPVDLGAAGAGELVLDLRASEVRVALGGLTVRVYGTIAPDALVDVARSLRSEQGTVREPAGD